MRPRKPDMKAVNAVVRDVRGAFRQQDEEAVVQFLSSDYRVLTSDVMAQLSPFERDWVSRVLAWNLVLA